MSMIVRLLHRFVRQSWHPTALMLDTDLPKLTNHRKNDNLGTRLQLFRNGTRTLHKSLPIIVHYCRAKEMCPSLSACCIAL